MAAVQYFVQDKYIEEAAYKEGLPVFAIGEQVGVLVDKASLKSFLEKIKHTLEVESACEYEGISVVTLKKVDGAATTATAPAENKKERVKVASWNGSEALKTHFKDVANKVVKELGMDVAIHVPHGDVIKADPKSKVFNIYIWSGAGNRGEKVLSPQKMWDLLVSCRDSYDFTTVGKPIMVPEGFVVGDLVYNNLFIFHDIAHNGVGEELKLFEKFLDEAIYVFKNGARKLEDFLKIHRDAYVKMCKNRSELKLKELKSSIDQHENKIKEHTQQLINTIRLLSDSRDIIFNLEKKNPDENEKFADEFEAMIKDEKIRQITCSGDTISIITKKLCCEDSRTKKMHEIGEFIVQLNINTGDLRYTNRTRRIHAMEVGMHGPHIFPRGNPCQGSLGEILPKLVATQEFAAIISLAIQFVETANVVDSAGAHVHMWPYVGESEEDYKKRFDKILKLKQEGKSYLPKDTE